MNKSTEQLIREVLKNHPQYYGKPQAIIEEIKNTTTTEGYAKKHKRRTAPTTRECTSIVARLTKLAPVPTTLASINR